MYNFNCLVQFYYSCLRVDAEYVNGEDLNGNGEEQNNHLEEFDFQPNNDDQHRHPSNHTNGNPATNGNVYSERSTYPSSAIESWNCAAQTQDASRETQCLSNNIAG